MTDPNKSSQDATGSQNIQAINSTVNVSYGAALPAPAPIDLAAALARLAALPLDHAPEPAPALPSGSRMPYARNPLFVGREHELRALAAILKGGTTAAISPLAAVRADLHIRPNASDVRPPTAAISQLAAATGLGGIGKTHPTYYPSYSTITV
jgi:hypothetical protein